MKPLLTPIIFCGSGSNLYPLCDATSSATSASKALLPIANRPMLAFALQSLASAGFAACIVLAPSGQHSSIMRSLSNVKLIAPQNILIPSERRKTKESKDDKGTMSIVFEDATLTAAMHEGAAASSSATLQSSMTVDLLPLGPHDGNNVHNKITGIKDCFRNGTLGTAELLRWLDAIGKLDADPLVLPVDLIAPIFPVRDLIDAYIQSQAQNAESPSACCALYERGAGEGVGREREREGPARLISAFAIDSTTSRDGYKPTHRLLFLRDSDLSEDLQIRRSLLQFSPRSRISTRLLDAHAYILNKAQVMPLLDENPSLTSLRDHVLPLIAKVSWQPGLRQKANWTLSNKSGDNGAEAYDIVNDTDNDPLQTSQTLPMEGERLQEEAIARSAGPRQARPKSSRKSTLKGLSDNFEVQCTAIIVRLDDTLDSKDGNSSATSLPPFIARANTVATYLECNRWLLKALSGSSDQNSLSIPEVEYSSPSTTAVANETPHSQISAPTSGIASSAQISNDSIVGNSVAIGDRASIKRSTIGANCEIGRGARIAGCVLMDGAFVGENARLENVICCTNGRIGDRSTLKDCDIAAGVVVMPDTTAKNEKLAGDRDSEEESEDDEEDD